MGNCSSRNNKTLFIPGQHGSVMIRTKRCGFRNRPKSEKGIDVSSDYRQHPNGFASATRPYTVSGSIPSTASPNFDSTLSSSFDAPPPYSAVVQQTMVAHDAFDVGARFGPGSTRHVPPPPPGQMPNSAQQAVAQGHPVVVGQRRSSKLF